MAIQVASMLYKRATDALGTHAVEHLLQRPIIEAQQAYSNAYFNFDDAGAQAYKDIITLKMMAECKHNER